jgi:hypothetical protein
VSARVSFRLKNQEAPFLIEAMTIPAPAMKMIVPRTGEIGIRSLVSADIRLFACVGDAESCASLSYRVFTLCGHRGFFGCMELFSDAPIAKRTDWGKELPKVRFSQT